jgi:hypothetical protein
MATSPIYSWPEPDNTDLVKNGALAIRTLGNAIDTTMGTMTPKSIVDAKGDLIAATANDTPARLAVGANGETLVADSSTSTGLRYQGQYAAGKNAIINGAFNVWQRGTTFTNLANFAYFADRFYSVSNNSGGSVTYTRQAFTGTDIPVAGAQYYMRTVGASPTGASFNVFGTKLENVQTLAGQTVTFSFYAKADSARTVRPDFGQVFGTGGSSSVTTTGSNVSLTTSWARYSQTFTMPSISGKTIGTDSYIQIELIQPLNVSHTIEYYGFQLEAGSVATPFQTATGTIQGELAACQRYYYRANSSTAYGLVTTFGAAYSTTGCEQPMILPVTMRTTSTTIDYSNIIVYDAGGTSYALPQSITASAPALNIALIRVTFSSAVLTQYRATYIGGNNNAAAYLGISAEL